MDKEHRNNIRIALVGGILIVLILVFGTLWMGQSSMQDTNDAVRSVSMLYLEELAGRREQVVEKNLDKNIQTINVAVDFMTDEDLSDMEHLQAFQLRMKTFFHLEKFAFVDTNGLIYTSKGTQTDIENYGLDYLNMTGPDIHVKDIESEDKKVIIAVPIKHLSFNGQELVVCFMEEEMTEMFSGASINADSDSEATFCNIYSADGISLSNKVLSGQADVKNLFHALESASFDEDFSLGKVKADFSQGQKGVVSFSYHDINETLCYMPITGTDWLLTYLIRESIISDSIGSVSKETIIKSIVQALLTALVLVTVLVIILKQTKSNAKLTLEKETAEAEKRVKQEELDEKLMLQDELQQALKSAEQANKAKTAFLSNMSHEIRTPMNAIIGLNSIILNDETISEITRSHSEKIGASANHLLGIINDILDMSRIESGRMVIKNEEFSFPKMLEQVNTIISGQCRDKGIKYECRLVGNICDYYFGDDVKLRQVLINILGNAVKFTPSNGEVSFIIENTARYNGNSTLKFTMKDTGIGMSKEYLPHLFDAFSQEDSSSTNKYGSTGLGMPITKSMVELMNGHIEVESEKGKGTTFTVTVTLSESEHEASVEQTGKTLEPKDIKVLVIDDDPVACEHAKVVLGQVGISCDTCLSGQEGIDKIKVLHVRREGYNLILVDWKMPEMDGIETTKAIRDIVGYDTPIVILTSYNWDDIIETARAAGVDSFVAKPLFVHTVLDEFNEAFAKKNEGSKKKAELEGRRILLAEDVSVNAEIMVMVLSMKNITAEVAENGKIAVEKFTEHPAGYYDAILMDMRMPEMDGLQATKAIRSLDRDDAKTIPIIALTANAFDEDVQRSLQVGMNAHLSKPVEPERLYQTLEELIWESKN
jgi:signal transduction histidine kinase/DNA-binding response OmpR family regulator